MTFLFYGYECRNTCAGDLPLLMAWTRALPGGRARAMDMGFWLKQGDGRQSFLVSQEGEPLAVFQAHHVQRDQVRLHFQASPTASPKKLLRGITKLVPLIEQALRLRGVAAIFFTSKSLAMAGFMYVHHNYEWLGKVGSGEDGWVMAKRFEAGK
jgi:hypothetical protein